MLAHLGVNLFDAATEHTSNFKGNLSALYPLAQDPQIHLNPWIALVRLDFDAELARLVEQLGPRGFVCGRDILDQSDGEVPASWPTSSWLCHDMAVRAHRTRPLEARAKWQ